MSLPMFSVFKSPRPAHAMSHLVMMSGRKDFFADLAKQVSKAHFAHDQQYSPVTVLGCDLWSAHAKAVIEKVDENQDMNGVGTQTARLDSARCKGASPTAILAKIGQVERTILSDPSAWPMLRRYVFGLFSSGIDSLKMHESKVYRADDEQCPADAVACTGLLVLRSEFILRKGSDAKSGSMRVQELKEKGLVTQQVKINVIQPFGEVIFVFECDGEKVEMIAQLHTLDGVEGKVERELGRPMDMLTYLQPLARNQVEPFERWRALVDSLVLKDPLLKGLSFMSVLAQHTIANPNHIEHMVKRIKGSNLHEVFNNLPAAEIRRLSESVIKPAVTDSDIADVSAFFEDPDLMLFEMAQMHLNNKLSHDSKHWKTLSISRLFADVMDKAFEQRQNETKAA